MPPTRAPWAQDEEGQWEEEMEELDDQEEEGEDIGALPARTASR